MGGWCGFECGCGGLISLDTSIGGIYACRGGF
jgi:hypothetical protein